MQRFDVVIVGGGTAGCVLAARLTEDPNRRVCLIEAGPDYGPLADRERGRDGNPVDGELALRPDAAPQQDRRREVGARREDDGIGVDALTPGEHADRALRRQLDPVDERVGQNRQVRPLAGGVEVSERRVPADAVDRVRGKRRHADGMGRVVRVGKEREAERLSRLEERGVKRRRRGRVRRGRAQLGSRPL